MNTDLRKKAKIDFEKDFFKLINNTIFFQNYEKYEKKQRYQTCNSRKKNELFSIRTKLLYYKDFYRKCISNRNERKRYL